MTNNTKKEEIQTPGGKYFYATGKRKTSVARVRLYKGAGKIMVNNQDFTEYFSVKSLHSVVKAPLKLTGDQKNYDIVAVITGGGVSSQADALAHGIAKALVEIDNENRGTLKKAGKLTRDSRTKERRKYGLKKARKAPQFSKR